jgi:excisionase family DNA binding protein
VANAWLTPREASDYARVNPITLKRAVQAGTLQAFRVNGGRLLRYRREDLDAWLSLAPVVKEAR